MTWREMWAVEMRDRKPLWIINLLLGCAAIGQMLGSLS